MPDDPVPASGVRMSICPWCSASYPGEPDVCPSCGAALAVDPTTDPSLPGLTAIDPEAVLRAKVPVARPRNRLLSWISGDYTDEVGTAAEEGALAPPPAEVRREMLRLELAAEVANLQAEADSYMADVVADGPVDGVAPVGDAPDATSPVDVADAADPAPPIDPTDDRGANPA